MAVGLKDDSGKRSFLRSIRGQLLIIMLGVALVPLALVSVLAYRNGEATLKESIGAELSSLSGLQAAAIRQWATDHTSKIVALASNNLVETMDTVKAAPAVVDYARSWPEFETLFVAGANGMTLATNNGKTLNLAERQYFREALQGKTVISEPLISEDTRNVVVVFAAPVKVNGKKVGVAGGMVSTEFIAGLLEHSQLGSSGDSYLINTAGYVVTPMRFEEELRSEGLIKERSELELKIESHAAEQVMAGSSGVEEYVNYRGRRVIGSYLWIPELGWGLITEQEQAEAYSSARALRSATLLIGLLSAVAVALVSLYFSTRIANPIRALSVIARELSEGKIPSRVQHTGRDELGELADSFRAMIAYQLGMTEIAGHIAAGNLAVNVKPKSADDLLGNAFLAMIEQLRGIVSQVAENANSLGAASGQLAATSAEAGRATNQIAATIQQVARGTGQQTESVTQTAVSVEQMSRAIEGIARGAQDQQQAVARASDVTSQLIQVIEQVAAGAQAGAKGASEAAEVATGGAAVVVAAVQGMESIREKVGVSARKVAEMGQRSDQIGVIVETIDEIAGQTNLLALNAAIEAARAGEHGKGFAVVADEVRKLAERSSAATKEIAELIKDIQLTVTEAVEAMEAGAQEVEAGVSQAEQAGAALEDIQEAALGVNRQADSIATAALQMKRLSDEMVAAMDSVSAVVEQNTAATQQMAANSAEVNRAIENIASIGEENSAAVEEVSAATEEMSAQVEEVSASAQSLAEMASKLQEIVAQFKLESRPVGQQPVLMPSSQGNGHKVGERWL